jgi:hypothetical protein
LEEVVSKSKQEKAAMSVIDRLPEEAEEGFAYFWEKEASKPSPGIHDEPRTYRITDDERLRKLVIDLKSRTLGKKVPFLEVNPADTSVIKWVQRIIDAYPKLKEDTIDDLLSSFRGTLKTSSKKKKKFIVGVLLLKGLLLIIHSRIDLGLFRGKGSRKEMYTADLVLHPKNVLRAALIEFADDETHLSAYEYDRSMSKGHAEFWGMKARDIRWEQAGTVRFTYWIDSHSIEIERCAEFDEIEKMFDDGELGRDGEGRLGAQDVRVIRVEMGRSTYTFPDFYQHYILLTEEIKRHQSLFNKLVDPNSLPAYDPNLIGKFDYEEDLANLYEIKPGPHVQIHEKKHGRFTLCFFTGVPPGIRPLPKLSELFFSSVFENRRARILHVGERVAVEPTIFGKLEIFNEIELEQDSHEFINEILKKIGDSGSKKGKALLQSFLCMYLRRAVNNIHFPIIFNHIFTDYLSKKLDGEFKKSGLIEKEGSIEFKSKDSVDSSPKKFAEKLAKTVSKYHSDDKWSRLCILYGVEDDGSIEPIGNMPNDRVTTIEELTNRKLVSKHMQVEVHSIKAKGGFVLMVLLLPKS